MFLAPPLRPGYLSARVEWPPPRRATRQHSVAPSAKPQNQLRTDCERSLRAVVWSVVIHYVIAHSAERAFQVHASAVTRRGVQDYVHAAHGRLSQRALPEGRPLAQKGCAMPH